MKTQLALQQSIFGISGEDDFQSAAIEVFSFQYDRNKVYRSWCDALGTCKADVKRIDQIPFLPVEFFRTHEIIADGMKPGQVFISSGTTAESSSRHLVADEKLYRESFLRCFELFYGRPEEYTILALLPSYLDRTGSSLVYMVSELIHRSTDANSGFYLRNLQQLHQQLQQLSGQNRKTLLLGVTYALLDLAAIGPVDFPDLVVMETGGMKGKRKEMIREEVHQLLQQAWHVSKIHSEYGMTELLSQAYSAGEGRFFCPPWMKIAIRDINDPLSSMPCGKTGGINIIDLANIYSCSFIAVQDLGKLNADGSFEVLGRFDHSQTRGCNLMADALS